MSTYQFVSTWYPIEDSSLTVHLPITSAADICVNWGDGTVDGHSTTAVNHNYSTSGEKTISISGSDFVWDVCGCNAIDSRIPALVKSQLRGVSECGGVLRLGNSGEQFAGCSQLQWTATDGPDGMSSVDTLFGCFKNCASLTTVPPQWDTSGVTNFTNMFYGTGVFESAKPKFTVLKDRSWLLPDASYIEQLIPNNDVSALSAYKAKPYDSTAFGVFVVGGNRAPEDVPASTAVDTAASTIAATDIQTSMIRMV